MSELLPLFLVFLILEALQLAAIIVLVYRSLAKRVLDPLGLDSRVTNLDARVGAVERYQVTLARQATEMERRLFERLDDVSAQQTKVLGHLTAVEAGLNAEQKERREITTRIDQVHSALTNFGQRFGAIESALQKVLDARPSGEQA